jgi:hypothetical protein
MTEPEPPPQGWTLREAAASLFPEQWKRASQSDIHAEDEIPRALLELLAAGVLSSRGSLASEPLKGASDLPSSIWEGAWPELGFRSMPPWVDRSREGLRRYIEPVPLDTVTLQAGGRLVGVRVFAGMPRVAPSARAELLRAFMHGYAAATLAATSRPPNRDDRDMQDAAKAAVLGVIVDEIRAAYAALPRGMRNPSPEERQAERHRGRTNAGGAGR